MKVVYYSFSGNVRRFISRAGIKDTFEITQDNCNESVNEPYILVTGTIDLRGAAAGSIFFKCKSYSVTSCCCEWKSKLQNFAKAGHTISEEYKVPLMMKFEVQRTNKDIIEFKDKVGNFNENHGRKEIQSY